MTDSEDRARADELRRPDREDRMTDSEKIATGIVDRHLSIDDDDKGLWNTMRRDLARDIAAAIDKEREACADIADQHASVEGIAQRIAVAIRARGES